MTQGSLIGRVLGGTYEVLRRLGEGGAGEVYAARHARTQRVYAVKVMKLHVGAAGHRRFKREADALARLGHAGIVPIHDFAETDDGIAYLVMDLLEGEDLATRLTHRRLTWAETLHIATRVADAVAAAHDVGIVHRDLKPSNIFLATKPGLPEQVVMLDFGMAKIADDTESARVTTSGTVLGTPLYMAPEQATGSDVDMRADVFALGVICYEMASGDPPFVAPTVQAVLVRVLTAEPAPVAAPHLPAGIDAVLRTALAKDPVHRFASLREFSMALQALPAPAQAGAPSLRNVPAPIGRAAGPAQSRTALPRALMAAGALALLGAAGLHFFGTRAESVETSSATAPARVIEGATPAPPPQARAQTVPPIAPSPPLDSPSVVPASPPDRAAPPPENRRRRLVNEAAPAEAPSATPPAAPLTPAADALLRSGPERAVVEDLQLQLREIEDVIAAVRRTRALVLDTTNDVSRVCRDRDAWIARRRDNNRSVASAGAVLSSHFERLCDPSADADDVARDRRLLADATLEMLGQLRATQRIHQDALDRTMASYGL